MKKMLLLAVAMAAFGANAFAHQAFTLVSSEKKDVKLADLSNLEKQSTQGKKEGTTLTFSEREIRLVIGTGPEDDMLSYWIQGMRNPTLVVPAEAVLKILFINKDVDMRHDVRFGHVVGEFPIAPEIALTAGSTPLGPKTDAGVMKAEEIVIKATENGQYRYFCSIRGHAKGGMWGNIAVGVKPAANLKMPVKTEHVHSPDEDAGHAHDTPPQVKPTASPTPHAHTGQPGGTASPTPHDHTQTKGMGHDESQMSSTVNIGDPMGRESSGTAWNPDSTPVYGKMKMFKNGGMLMAMGSMFVRYTSIGSSRDVSVAGKGGRSRADAPSMFMLMYSKPVSENTQIGLRAMVSLDPIIQRGWGYPLLYQSGELYRGQPIHDRQHPHDFFSELAVSVSHRVDDKRSVYLYAGYPGEPAYGPPVFMHRQSAANNPDAPISHHWQDATHITWGVVTGGFSFGKAKIEASIFNGREPDENRWNFDRPRLNSYSGRVSLNPTKNWAFQLSHAYLRDPEPHEPEIRILRKFSASAIYNKELAEDRNFAAGFVWGQNYANRERSNSFLFESNYDFAKNAVFGRFETVKKSGHDLVLDHPLDHEQFWLNALSLGYVRDLVQGKGIDVGVGSMVIVNHNPSRLAPVYGGKTHSGWQVFLRFRPSKMKH